MCAFDADTSSKHFNINVFIIIYASLFGMLCETASRFWVSKQTSGITRSTSHAAQICKFMLVDGKEYAALKAQELSSKTS
jgi:hypothetical protein